MSLFKRFLIIGGFIILCGVNARLNGQTENPSKFLYPLPNQTTTAQFSDSSSLDIILDKTSIMFADFSSIDRSGYDFNKSTNYILYDGVFLRVQQRIPIRDPLSPIGDWLDSSDPKDFFVFTRIFIAKILNPQGVNVADIRTPSYDRKNFFGYPIEIRGRTRTPDGGIIELNQSEISRIKMAEDQYQSVFSLPGVEKGSIIQFEYVIVYDHHIQLSHVFESNHSFPSKQIIFEVVPPQSKSLDLLLESFPENSLPAPIDISLNPVLDLPKIVWRMENNPEIQIEDFMPSESALTPKAYFSVLSSKRLAQRLYRSKWSGYGKETLWKKRIEPKLKRDSGVKNAVQKQVKNLKNRQEKVEKLLSFFQNNFHSLYIDVLPDQHLERTFKEKAGGRGDLAALFYQMLKHAGVKPHFALTRSRSKGGYPKKAPMIDWFDRMLIMVAYQGDTVWVDPSSRTSKFGVLPMEAQGVDAFVFNHKDAFFTKTPATDLEQNYEIKTFNARLRDDGRLAVSTLFNRAGEYDRLQRLDYKDAYQREIRRGLRRQIVSHFPEAVLKENFRISDVKDYATNFTVSFDFETPHFLTESDSGGFSYFEPFLLSDSEWLPELAVRPRKHRIQLPFAHRKTTRVTWEIPPSFEIAALPESRNDSTSFAHYVSRFEVAGNKITAERILRLRREMLDQTEAGALREFAGKIRVNGKEKIVVRKK